MCRRLWKKACDSRSHIAKNSAKVFTIHQEFERHSNVSTHQNITKHNQPSTRFLAPVSDSWLTSIPLTLAKPFPLHWGVNVSWGERAEVCCLQSPAQAFTPEATKVANKIHTSQCDMKSRDRILILLNCFPCRVTTLVNWKHFPWD